MNLTGDAVLDALTGADSIRDAVLRSVLIGEEADKAFVRLQFSGRIDSKYEAIELTLRDIVRYGFYGSGELGGRDVEMLKFLIVGEREFYLSLDPYDERIESPAEEDNDFVHARSVEAVLTVR